MPAHAVLRPPAPYGRDGQLGVLATSLSTEHAVRCILSLPTVYRTHPSFPTSNTRSAISQTAQSRQSSLRRPRNPISFGCIGSTVVVLGKLGGPREGEVGQQRG